MMVFVRAPSMTVKPYLNERYFRTLRPLPPSVQAVSYSVQQEPNYLEPWTGHRVEKLWPVHKVMESPQANSLMPSHILPATLHDGRGKTH